MRLICTPKKVFVAITNNCNLRCKYCYHFTDGAPVTDDLSTREWLSFFKELNRCCVMRVTLEGGEPFFRNDLRELISSIIQNRMRYSILTNGTLITDEMARFIASTGRCDFVQVSLDGSTPAAHDSMRGEGSFTKALEGIKSLKRHNIRIMVRTTIHKQNVNDLGQMARLLLEEMGLPNFSTNSASYRGLCRSNAGQVQLDAAQRSAAMKELLRLDKIYPGRIKAAAGPLSQAKGWYAYEKARINGRGRTRRGGYLGDCGQAIECLSVRADGVIVPCILLSHIELGRINRDSLEEIWQGHPEMRKLRERGRIPLSNFEYCRGCVYINYCSAGCPSMSYDLTGDAYRPSSNACLKHFLEEGGKLPQEDLFTTP